MHRAHARLFLVCLVLVAMAIGSGCLRRKFDLCLEDPPHPDCPHDAGPDASSQADAPAPSDAGAAEDAATHSDAAATDAP